MMDKYLPRVSNNPCLQKRPIVYRNWVNPYFQKRNTLHPFQSPGYQERAIWSGAADFCRKPNIPRVWSRVLPVHHVQAIVFRVFSGFHFHLTYLKTSLVCGWRYGKWSQRDERLWVGFKSKNSTESRADNWLSVRARFTSLSRKVRIERGHFSSHRWALNGI